MALTSAQRARKGGSSSARKARTPQPAAAAERSATPGKRSTPAKRAARDEEDVDDDLFQIASSESSSDSSSSSAAAASEWIVRDVTGRRTRAGVVYYLVQWGGTDSDGKPWKPSWEPAENLVGARKLVEAFEAALKKESAPPSTPAVAAGDHVGAKKKRATKAVKAKAAAAKPAPRNGKRAVQTRDGDSDNLVVDDDNNNDSSARAPVSALPAATKVARGRAPEQSAKIVSVVELASDARHAMDAGQRSWRVKRSGQDELDVVPESELVANAATARQLHEYLVQHHVRALLQQQQRSGGARKQLKKKLSVPIFEAK